MAMPPHLHQAQDNKKQHLFLTGGAWYRQVNLISAAQLLDFMSGNWCYSRSALASTLGSVWLEWWASACHATACLDIRSPWPASWRASASQTGSTSVMSPSGKVNTSQSCYHLSQDLVPAGTPTVLLLGFDQIFFSTCSMNYGISENNTTLLTYLTILFSKHITFYNITSKKYVCWTRTSVIIQTFLLTIQKNSNFFTIQHFHISHSRIHCFLSFPTFQILLYCHTFLLQP